VERRDLRPETAAPTDLPDGLLYEPEFLSPDEEEEIRARLAALALGEVRMHGVVARRRVAHFGLDYAYDARAVQPGPPLPGFLLPLRERAAALAGVAPGALAEALVTRYPPGAAIGWHRDAPPFGVVVGVSFGAPARLRLRRGGPGGDGRELVLRPGSAYVLARAARWGWQHAVPPAKAERWSVTFRTVRTAGAPRRGGAS
jgi:alkylated DNA repair protein (DNA oxidative demethylase)